MANIEHINVLKAPIAKVYEALTTEEGLAAVWTSELKVKPEVGFINTFSFGAETDHFEIKALVPNQRVLWYCIDSDPQWIGTSVSFDLEEKRGKTFVTLKQTDWAEVTEFYRHCNYNWAFFLYSLQCYCENGKGINYQQRY